MPAGSDVGDAPNAADAVRAGGASHAKGADHAGDTVTQRPVVLRGRIWPGGDAAAFVGAVALDEHGRIVDISSDGESTADAGPIGRHRAPEAPTADVPVPGAGQAWIGPGIVDAHVHQAFASEPGVLGPGLVGARDLGAPLERALGWQRSGGVSVSGPILTASGGYPSLSWGRAGFSLPISSLADATAAVRQLAEVGVDVIKVALEPGPGWPVPTPATLRALVDCAHGLGLPVVAHALSLHMVRRALDAVVDELAHTPTDRLPDADVERIAAAGVSVVSTLQTFFAGSDGRSAAANAADLVSAGVVLRYGTDLGNAGTTSGADPRELDRLADAGLGRRGALVAATLHAAAAPGMRGQAGLLQVGDLANLVVLSADPELEPAAWRCPVATFIGGVPSGLPD